MTRRKSTDPVYQAQLPAGRIAGTFVECLVEIGCEVSLPAHYGATRRFEVWALGSAYSAVVRADWGCPVHVQLLERDVVGPAHVLFEAEGDGPAGVAQALDALLDAAFHEGVFGPTEGWLKRNYG